MPVTCMHMYMHMYMHMQPSTPPLRATARQRAHQVQRQAVVCEHDDEEYAVHEEVQHVLEQLQVEHGAALAVPAALERRVRHGQQVLGERHGCTGVCGHVWACGRVRGWACRGGVGAHAMCVHVHG
jgi:hypothetical protein